MRMAGTQKRQQGECRDSRVGVPPCPATVMAKHRLLLTGAVAVCIPSSIRRLDSREPSQRGDHGSLRFRAAALQLDQTESARGIPQ